MKLPHYFSDTEINLYAADEQPPDARVRAVMNTRKVDTVGHLVLNWELSEFLKRPVMLADHGRDIGSQIGRWDGVEADGDALKGEAVYFTEPALPGGENLPHIQMARVAFDLALRKAAAYSISFRPGGLVSFRGDKQYSKLPEAIRKHNPRVVIEKAFISETSHVTVPANRDAIQMAEYKKTAINPETRLVESPSLRLEKAIDNFLKLEV